MGKRKNQQNRNKKWEDDEIKKEEHAAAKEDKKDAENHQTTKHVDVEEPHPVISHHEDAIPSDTEADASLDMFDRFFDMMEASRKFAINVQTTIEKLKDRADGFESREASAVKEMEDSIERFKNVEQEAIDMVKELQNIYDGKVSGLRKHYENQFSEMQRMYADSFRKMKRRLQSTNSADIPKSAHSQEIEQLHDKIDALNANHRKAIKELENEKSTIEKEKKALEKRVKELEEQNAADSRKKSNVNEDLNSKIKVKEQKIVNLEERIEKVKTEKEDLHVKCRDLEKSCQKLNKELKELKENSPKTISIDHSHKDHPETKTIGCLKSLEFNSENFEKVISELIMTRIELRKAHKDFDHKVTLLNDAREELSDAQASIKSLEAQLKKEKNALDEYKFETSQIMAENSLKKRKIDRLENEVLTLNCNIEKDKKNLDFKIKEITELKEKETKYLQQKSELERRNDMLLSEVEMVKRKLAQMKLEYDKKTEGLTKMTRDLKKLENSYSVVKKLSAELEAQVKWYQEKHSEISSTRTDMQHQFSSFEDKTRKLEERFEAAQHECNSLAKKLAQKEEQMSQLSDQKDGEYQQLSQKYDELLELCHHVKNDLAYYKSIVNEKEQDGLDVQRRYNEAVNELIRIKEEASSHISSISQLSQQVQELEDQLYVEQEQERVLGKQIQSYRQQISELEEAYRREKVVWSTQSEQHMNLIKFIQSQFSKKKKLSSKDFKLENLPNVEDIESKMAKSVAGSSETSSKSDQMDLKKELTAILKNAEQEAEQQQPHQKLVEEAYGESQMPDHCAHRYELVKIGFTLPCLSCGRDMYFGQKAKRCVDCSSTIHFNCEPNNYC